jgi:F-type H+-transporting ATPase subunit gamma
MAQLIQMRQRIKAIETIKKITHAMQLISMSMHSRLRSRTPHLNKYQQEVEHMLNKVRRAAPSWHNPLMYPDVAPETNPLIILVASQKGLCGNFNTTLFYKFKSEFSSNFLRHAKIITVGKHAQTYSKHNPLGTVIASFDKFSSTKLNHISERIVAEISLAKTPYSSVIIVANGLKTFFVQHPVITTVLPLETTFDTSNGSVESGEPYTWEQAPAEILDDLALQYLTATVYKLLFQSLLAEQAARFLSMDNATRNAQQLLEDTQLQYNKLRQAKITRELTELSASFQN